MKLRHIWKHTILLLRLAWLHFVHIRVPKEKTGSEDSIIGGRTILSGSVQTNTALRKLLCYAGPFNCDLGKSPHESRLNHSGEIAFPSKHRGYIHIHAHTHTHSQTCWEFISLFLRISAEVLRVAGLMKLAQVLVASEELVLKCLLEKDVTLGRLHLLEEHIALDNRLTICRKWFLHS